MKKLTFISSLLLLAFIAPVMADGPSNPVEYHGSATRITPDGKINAREGKRHSALWPLAPALYIYKGLEAPSAKGSSDDSGSSNTFGKCLANLCPITWLKKCCSKSE